ncbi:ribonuclease H [Senna tora]|uniref:Ribonuclease H n=1 Tax=Senna tora TaxID=362788 RepID=A0A834WFJ0_9FABA|nr:ribonuclease H [Senna tora]
MGQDSSVDPPPSSEEKDQMKRSIKKIKKNDPSVGDMEITDMMIEGDDGTQSNSISEGLEKMAGMDEDTAMGDTTSNDTSSREVKRSLWGTGKDGEISYRDKLLGFNGRGNEAKSDVDDNESIADPEEEGDLPGEKKESQGKYPPYEGSKKVVVGEEAFGPWMIPQRKFRRRAKVAQSTPSGNPAGQNRKQTNATSGSRYEAIASLNDDIGEEQQDAILDLVIPDVDTETIIKAPAILNSPDQTPVRQNMHKTRSRKGTTKKQSASSLIVRSPLKSVDRKPKPSSSQGGDSSVPKSKKPPDIKEKEMREQLNLMKAYERNMRALGDSLLELGATQVPGFPCLAGVATTPIPQIEEGKTVDRFVTPSGDWDWNSFSAFLPNDVLSTIESIHPPASWAGKDRLAWSPAADGVFSIKSAYSKLTENLTDNTNETWSKIWRIPAMERVRVFIWNFAHDALMTTSNRKTRGYCDNDICPKCQGGIESNLHAIRDCPTIKDVWKKLVDPDKWLEFSTMNSKDWVSANLRKNCGARWGFEWDSMFVVTSWLIWKQRRDWIFNDKHDNSVMLHYKILNSLKAYEEASRVTRLAEANTRAFKDINVSWKPPPPGFVKLNVDGSFWQQTNSVGCRGVIRDSNGNWLAGFSRSLGRGNSLLAELWGFKTGLQLAWNRGFQNIVLEGDCKMAIDLISRDQDTAYPLFLIISEIRVLMSKFCIFSLKHVFREGNRVADVLSNHSHKALIGETLFENVPPFCSLVFQDDGRGVSFPRSVAV